MGVSRSIYIGVYLEVPFYKSEVKSNFYINANGKKVSHRFNKETGVEHELKKEVKIKMFEPCPYITDNDKLYEDMFTTGAYYEGNEKRPFTLNSNSKYSKHEDDIFNFDISGVNINELIISFKEDYKEYLDYYKTKYGEFEIKYGIVVTDN